MHTKLNLHNDDSLTLIRSYENGKLQIGDTEFTESVIVTPELSIRWPLTAIELLTDADFKAVFELDFKPELVLLGTGDTLQFPEAQQTRSLVEAQIGIEVMNTLAACRTYNVLADDRRRVVACLLV